MGAVIIDYRGGNASSVSNAFTKIGISSRLVSKPSEIAVGDTIVLPGVGSARSTLASLAELDLDEIIVDRVKKGQCAYLGICVGMQILFAYSEEEKTPCWGILPGEVKKFSSQQIVPLMGWMPVRLMKNSPEIFRKQLLSRQYFYFVNSYYCVPKNETAICGKTEYNNDFCSMTFYKNICGTQFHVEKSGVIGLKFLKLIYHQLQAELERLKVKKGLSRT